MKEREIVTVGFGNYATLLAAQWANSTSHHDVHHDTLYRERSRAHVMGGSDVVGGMAGEGAVDLGGGGGGGGRVRVPRLLLLDAPHAADFWEVGEIEAEMAARGREHGSDEDVADTQAESGGGRHGSHRDPAPTLSSLLWSSSSAQRGGGGGGAPTEEEERLARVARYAQRRGLARGHHRRHRDTEREKARGSDSAEDGEARTSDEEEEEEGGGDYYVQLPRRGGDGAGRSGIEVDQAYGSDQDGRAQSPPSPDAPPPDAAAARETYMRALFQRRDTTVPWWRYITTGLDAESVTALRPPHTVDGTGAIPAMHSFGYGLATFRSTQNSSAGSGAEAEALSSALRRQLEDADGLQGLQCFVDGDSMFGGAAVNTLQEFWEDAGSKVPVAVFTVFAALPTAVTDAVAARDVPFAERRREEAALNRLLATSMLSAPPSAVYIPVEPSDWPTLFAAGGGGSGAVESACWWLEDDTASAQYLASVADSALYGARDGGRGGGPAHYMDDWARTLRPMPYMRVSAMLGSLPMPLPAATDAADAGPEGDLWSLLERYPLLPDATRASRERRYGGFVPLTHALDHSPLTEAGRVLGHTVTLRGAGRLPSRVYATQEAMLRYALPLRTSTYLHLLTGSGAPVSSTFPVALLFPSQAAMTALESQCATVGVSLRDTVAANGVDVGAHVVTTHQSAPMLARVLAEARAALRYKEHVHSAAYHVEKDDWVEWLEDVAQVHDDYRHEDAAGSDDDGDGGGQDW